MSHEKGDDFYELTFAQRKGKVPLPEPMKLEHVPRKFKQLVWLAIEQEIDDYLKQKDKFWKREIIGLNNIMEEFYLTIDTKWKGYWQTMRGINIGMADGVRMKIRSG